MKYLKISIILLSFFSVITLYDMNIFLSIGMVSIFLIINSAVFIYVTDNIMIGCRNIFGLLSIEITIYWIILSMIKQMDFVSDYPKIDFNGIASSLIFSAGISFFFCMLFLVIDFFWKGK
jgi:hypothetical protein